MTATQTICIPGCVTVHRETEGQAVVHDGPLTQVIGEIHPNGSVSTVDVRLSAYDGDRAFLMLSGDTLLDADGTRQLIAALRDRLPQLEQVAR